jgi:hypothetical protein
VWEKERGVVEETSMVPVGNGVGRTVEEMMVWSPWWLVM